MIKHFKYISYLARHKWFVFVAGLKTGAPLWKLIVHDLSKFRPDEWGPYADWFFDRSDSVDEQKNQKRLFEQSFTLHQKRNEHHWQHWLAIDNLSGKSSIVLTPIPESVVREMVADWMGAGRVITGRWEVHEWYDKNRKSILLHGTTRILVEDILTELKDGSHEL